MNKNLFLTAIATICCVMISCSKEQQPDSGNGSLGTVPAVVEPVDLTEGWIQRDDLTESEYLSSQNFADVYVYPSAETLNSADYQTNLGTDEYLLVLCFDENGMCKTAQLLFGYEDADAADKVVSGVNTQFSTDTSIPAGKSTCSIIVGLKDISGINDYLIGKALTVVQTGLGTDIDTIIRDWISALRMTPEMGENWSMPDVYTLSFKKIYEKVGKVTVRTIDQGEFSFDFTGKVQSSKIFYVSTDQDTVAESLSSTSQAFRTQLAQLSRELPDGLYGFLITIGSSFRVNPFASKTRSQIASLTSVGPRLLMVNQAELTPGKQIE